jgi:hypothetical protein
MKYKLLVFDDVIDDIATYYHLGNHNTRHIEVFFLLLPDQPLQAVLFLVERT